MRFDLRLLSLLMALGLALSACAAPVAPAPAPSPEKASVGLAAPTAPLTREQQLIEGAKKEGEVALWLTTIQQREKLTKLFQERYPFLKLKIWDARGTEINTKLAEEAKASRTTADVVLVGAGLADLHGNGLLAEYDFPNTVGWTGQPTHKYYAAFVGTGRVVAYNTNLVSPAEVPRSWDDVKSTKWAEKTIASTSGTDTPLFWAYLWREKDKLNWDKSFAFWEDVFRNTRPKLSTGYDGPLEQLAAGEFLLFPHVATPSPLRLKAMGAPVGIAPLGAVPLIASGLALVKGAPHPNAARLLIDFMTSPEGLLAYAEPSAMDVFDPKVREKARASIALRSMGVSMDMVPVALLTPENMKKSTEFWTKVMGRRG